MNTTIYGSYSNSFGITERQQTSKFDLENEGEAQQRFGLNSTAYCPLSSCKFVQKMMFLCSAVLTIVK